MTSFPHTFVRFFPPFSVLFPKIADYFHYPYDMRRSKIIFFAAATFAHHPPHVVEGLLLCIRRILGLAWITTLPCRHPAGFLTSLQLSRSYPRARGFSVAYNRDRILTSLPRCRHWRPACLLLPTTLRISLPFWRPSAGHQHARVRPRAKTRRILCTLKRGPQCGSLEGISG